MIDFPIIAFQSRLINVVVVVGQCQSETERETWTTTIVTNAVCKQITVELTRGPRLTNSTKRETVSLREMSCPPIVLVLGMSLIICLVRISIAIKEIFFV